MDDLHGIPARPRLRPLAAGDEEQAREAQRELALDEFEFLFDLRPGEPWSDYVGKLEARRRGVDLPVGRVPATFLVAEIDGRIVGRVSIRHVLNAFLAAQGGHIGYAVRPAFRRRGYATELLRQALVIAHDVGIERALLTCDPENAASARVIEKCGGVLEDPAVRPDDAGAKLRYWIDTRRALTASSPGSSA